MTLNNIWGRKRPKRGKSTVPITQEAFKQVTETGFLLLSWMWQNLFKRSILFIVLVLNKMALNMEMGFSFFIYRNGGPGVFWRHKKSADFQYQMVSLSLTLHGYRGPTISVSLFQVIVHVKIFFISLPSATTLCWAMVGGWGGGYWRLLMEGGNRKGGFTAITPYCGDMQ